MVSMARYFTLEELKTFSVGSEFSARNMLRPFIKEDASIWRISGDRYVVILEGPGRPKYVMPEGSELVSRRRKDSSRPGHFAPASMVDKEKVVQEKDYFGKSPISAKHAFTLAMATFWEANEVAPQ